MAGLNSQIHLFLSTETLQKLSKEAKELKISKSELIRRKLLDESLPEEILILRKLKEVIKDGKPTKNFN